MKKKFSDHAEIRKIATKAGIAKLVQKVAIATRFLQPFKVSSRCLWTTEEIISTRSPLPILFHRQPANFEISFVVLEELLAAQR